MLGRLASVNELPDNPFTPDFGQQPRRLVGRDDLVRSLERGLESGPRDPRFTSILLGPRGSGKTVILNHIKDEASASGWIVLSLDTTTTGVHQRINERIAWARSAHETLPEDGSDVTSRRAVTFKMSPFAWQREAIRTVRPEWGLRRQLTALADHAAQNDTAVLLVLDEMHSGDTIELRRLAADLQHITKGERLPLGFLGAGLSEMKHTLLDDKRMTFFARCNREDMPPLDRINAHRFLTATVTDAGGSFEGDALGALVDASGSLPYRMQLVGYNAWNASGAPANPVDERSSALAITEADRMMHERVSLPAWHALNETEQGYLQQLAAFGGESTPRQIAQYLSGDPKTLTRAWRRLENAGCIETGSDGRIRVADVIPVSSIEKIRAQEAMHAYDDEFSHQPRLTPRCNFWMPRARSRCVLSKGHAGGHRSQ